MVEQKQFSAEFGMNLNVCLLGGGTRLAAHLGALKAIHDQGGRISGWSGASAGSLVAAIRAGGYTHEMAVDLMRDTDYRQFLDFRPMGLVRGYGLCSGRRFEKWLDGVLEGRRFRDLEVPLSVVCTDILTGMPYIFSNDATPDEKISTAVRCSIGIPGIFAIRRLQDAVLVDGSLAAAEDSDLFPDSPHETLTIRLVRSQAARLDRTVRLDLSAYVQRVAGMLLDAADEPSISGDQWRRTLLVRTGEHSSINFKLSTADRDELFQMGYQQCHKFMDFSGDVIQKRSEVPLFEMRDHRSLEELAEEAIRMACDNQRSAPAKNAELPYPASEWSGGQISYNPNPKATGYGFDA